MKEKYIAYVLSIFLVITSYAVSVAAAPKLNTLATVSAVSGEVQVKKHGAGDWAAAADGTLLGVGDQLKTGSKSSCVIKWSQGNAVTLASFAALKIDQLEKNPAAKSETASLDLWSGKVYAKAKKLDNPQSTFELRTPTAIAGVRGTDFSVEVGADDSTEVGCFSGSVYVKSKAGGQVVLNENQKTSVKKNEPPEQPKELDDGDKQGFTEVQESADATLEVMQPIGNLETDTTPINIKGKTDPGNTVTVNGNPVAADSGGVFTASVDLEPGVNHIKIEALNKNGKSTTKTRVVKLRTEEEKETAKEEEKKEEEAAAASGEPMPPTFVLNVTSPRDGLTTKEPAVTVTGTASPPGAKVAVNGASVPIAPGDTSFSWSLTLHEGENRIEIVATLGTHTHSVVRMVTLDTLPPFLVINQPPVSFSINSGGCMPAGGAVECTVIGLTEPDAILTINGARYQVDADGSFSQEITLAYDQSTINIAAEDSVGNRTTQVLTRVIDVNAVSYLDVSVTPATITADGEQTAVVTVTALNILREGVSNIQVNLMATYGGSLVSPSLTTAGGTASTIFIAGTGSVANTVTITAISGTVSASTTLLLTPDKPPTPEE